MVPDYTTPALYRTKEPVFLRDAASPPSYISLAPQCSRMNSRLMTLSRMSPCETWGSGWLGGCPFFKGSEQDMRPSPHNCGALPRGIPPMPGPARLHTKSFLSQ